MKNRVIKRLIIVAIITLQSSAIQAQLQPAWVVGDFVGRTIPNIRAIGIGNFTTTPLRAALHVNTNFLPAANNFTPGEVFHTSGPSTQLNAWRLFTGTGNGTEKGMIFNYGNNPVVADQTNFSIQATVRDMTFFTLPITANTVGTERMRILANGNVQFTNLSNEKKIGIRRH